MRELQCALDLSSNWHQKENFLNLTETGKEFLLLVYSFVTLNSFRRER